MRGFTVHLMLTLSRVSNQPFLFEKNSNCFKTRTSFIYSNEVQTVLILKPRAQTFVFSLRTVPAELTLSGSRSVPFGPKASHTCVCFKQYYHISATTISIAFGNKCKFNQNRIESSGTFFPFLEDFI